MLVVVCCHGVVSPSCVDLVDLLGADRNRDGDDQRPAESTRGVKRNVEIVSKVLFKAKIFSK